MEMVTIREGARVGLVVGHILSIIVLLITMMKYPSLKRNALKIRFLRMDGIISKNMAKQHGLLLTRSRS